MNRDKPLSKLEIRRSMVALPDYKVPAGYVICPNYDCLVIMIDYRTVCFPNYDTVCFVCGQKLGA